MEQLSERKQKVLRLVAKTANAKARGLRKELISYDNKIQQLDGQRTRLEAQKQRMIEVARHGMQRRKDSIDALRQGMEFAAACIIAGEQSQQQAEQVKEVIARTSEEQLEVASKLQRLEKKEELLLARLSKERAIKAARRNIFEELEIEERVSFSCSLRTS